MEQAIRLADGAYVILLNLYPRPLEIREIARAATARYRKRHPEKIIAYRKTPQKRNYDKAWKLAHPENQRAAEQRYYQKSVHKIRAAARAYGRAHAAQRRAYYSQWLKDRPSTRAAYNAKTRAKRFGAIGAGVSAFEWRNILEIYNHRCAYCLRPNRKLTRDHVLALARGGEDTADNVVPACQSCNSRKGARGILFTLGRAF